MAPSPQHADGRDLLAASAEPSGGRRRILCEEEGTQTEDSDYGSGSWRDPAYPGADLDTPLTLDPSGSDSGSSVIERLSRGVVGRLFAPERQDRATQTVKDPLASETEKLAFDIVFYSIGRRKSAACDETTQCLRRSVQHMLDNHSLLFNGMIARLQLSTNSDLQRGFHELANELFSNNEVTWSKIIALYAFAARLALYCHEHNLANMSFDVASILSQCAVEKLTPFLRQHGGWSTLCEAFPLESDYESTIWKSLVITGLGLTVFASFLAWQR